MSIVYQIDSGQYDAPAPRCETCDSDFHVAKNEYGELICENCEQNAAERAWDRFCDKFYGGADPLTIREQSIQARSFK